MSKCNFLTGYIVESKHDVFGENSTPVGCQNLGKERFIVSKTEYWEQGKGYIVYGEISDKRPFKIWHHEDDLILISKNMPQKPPKSIRFPDDVQDAIEKKAKQRQRSFQWIVIEGMRKQLIDKPKNKKV
jgi:hypothetical protein